MTTMTLSPNGGWYALAMRDANTCHRRVPDGRARRAFPMLEADIGENRLGSIGTRKRICIATADVPGPVARGEVGAACLHLARSLSDWGHEVVIAFASGGARRGREMARTRDFCAGFGVSFVPIVPRPATLTPLGQASTPSWTLLEWLRACEEPFDIVHFPDRHGLGYGPLLGKSQGLAFAATHFVVLACAPTLLSAEARSKLLSSEHELGLVFMERRSVELADTVVSPSEHILGWMREAGYSLPARTFISSNMFPPPGLAREVDDLPGSDRAALEEVVFFGPLESGGGLALFIDAIERLVRQGRAPKSVAFLGEAPRSSDSVRTIRQSARGWPVGVRILADLHPEKAIEYLAHPGRLAVVPSLHGAGVLAANACLHARVPFVAVRTAGTLESIAPEDRPRVLVSPDHVALGDRIHDLASAPLSVVRPCPEFERSRAVWSRWHAQTGPFETGARQFEERARFADAETPLVTVCIVHYERPHLLRMAVGSVLAQDYPSIEVVLVDDGSEGAEALAVLDAIESEFDPRGWPVIRQENRYLGAARNTGAAAARGDWLLFLDDDNVLFPEAISRLVRAARFSGADCVPAASIRFSGNGDPRTDRATHGSPIRFLGSALAWGRFVNVVGDACALVRRDAFEAVGGFTEEYRVGFDDLSFFNRLLRAGHRIEPFPDPVYYYRVGKTSMKGRNRSAEAARLRVIAPYLSDLPAEERAFLSYATACIASPEARATRLLATMLARAWGWTRRLRARLTSWA